MISRSGLRLRIMMAAVTMNFKDNDEADGGGGSDDDDGWWWWWW